MWSCSPICSLGGSHVISVYNPRPPRLLLAGKKVEVIGQNLGRWPGISPYMHRGASWFQIEPDIKKRVSPSYGRRDLKMLNLNLVFQAMMKAYLSRYGDRPLTLR